MKKRTAATLPARNRFKIPEKTVAAASPDYS